MFVPDFIFQVDTVKATQRGLMQTKKTKKTPNRSRGSHRIADRKIKALYSRVHPSSPKIAQTTLKEEKKRHLGFGKGMARRKQKKRRSGETDIIDGAGIKVRVNPSTPETIKLSSPNSLPKKFNPGVLESSEPPVETLTRDFNSTGDRRVPPPPPLAFEVPVNEDSLIRKHPPKRFRRLEELQAEGSRVLTHELIDSKQQEAEMRRREILSQRIQSAQQKNPYNRKLVHSDAFSQRSDDLSEREGDV